MIYLSQFSFTHAEAEYDFLMSQQRTCYDTDYEKQLGHPIPYISPYEILVTEGRIREQAADIIIKAYLKVPETVRRIFAEQGFLIKMTEWDVTEEAYAPYGGYRGIGKVKTVFDYERKTYMITSIRKQMTVGMAIPKRPCILVIGTNVCG